MKSSHLPALALVILSLIEGTHSIRATQVPGDITGAEGDTKLFSCTVTGRTDSIALLWQIKFDNLADVIYKPADTFSTLSSPFGIAGNRGNYETIYSVQEGSTQAEHFYILTLKITGLTRNDAGQFGCAYQYVQTDSTVTLFHSLVSLNVLYPPDSPPMCSYTVTHIDNPRTPGSVSVNLLCNSQGGGNPPALLAWYYEADNFISDGGNTWITMPPSGEGRVLTCRATSPAITDYFSCSITPMWTNVLTTPQPQPQIYPPGNPTCSYSLVETADPLYYQVYFTCQSIGGNPLPDISWQTDQGTTLSVDAHLQLQMHVAASPRQYTCVVSSIALTEPLRCHVLPILPYNPTTELPPPPTPAPVFLSCSYDILTDPITSTLQPVTIRLNCVSAGGQPPVELSWYDSYNTPTTYVINIIPNPSQSFTCRTTNQASTTECTVTPELPPIPTTLIPTTVPVPPDLGYPMCSYKIVSEVSSTGAWVQLICTSMGGNPPAQLTWYDDSNYSLNSVASGLSNTLVSRQISRVYTCKATSVAITTERKCTVTPELPPIPTTLAPTTVPVPPNPGYPMCSYSIVSEVTPEGAMVRLNCISMGGNPPAYLNWYDKSNNVLHSFAPGLSTAYVFHQSGQAFTCRATSTAITLLERKCTVQPELPPIPTTLAPTTVAVPPNPGYPMCSYKIVSEVSPTGAMVQLDCTSIGGNPPAQLTWYDHSNNFIYNGAVYTTNVSYQSLQMFTCRATSPAITTDRICIVTPELPPIPTTIPPSTTPLLIPPDIGYPKCSYEITSEVTSDDALLNIRISCSSRGGSPSAQLTWYKYDGTFLSNDAIIVVNVNPQPGRFFTCRATSPAIRSERSCSVTPQRPPKPTTLAASTTPLFTTFKDTYPSTEHVVTKSSSTPATLSMKTTVHITTQSTQNNQQGTTIPSDIPTLHNTATNIKTSTPKIPKSSMTSMTRRTIYPVITKSPNSPQTNALAIVSIASGAIVLLILVLLIVGCLVRGVLRGSFLKPYRPYSNPTSNHRRSSSYPPLHPHPHVAHHVTNPVFEAHIITDSFREEPAHLMDDSFRPQQPQHTYSSVEDVSPNNHAYEYPTDDNPYEHSVNNHLYSETP